MGITIKGKSDGVFEIEIELSSTYAEIKNAIQKKLSRNKDFFSGTGARIIFTGKVLNEAQKKGLRRMLEMDYGVIHVIFSDETAENYENRDVKIKRAAEPEEEKSDGRISLLSKSYFNAKSIIVPHTVRSGQRIECEGDVVVLGDVNDGAEVIAGGSVIVMGILRGLVHAGAMGRSDVAVAANTLRPKQLRISGKIAIFPEGEESDVPQVAEFKQGTVVIRSLRPQQKKL